MSPEFASLLARGQGGTGGLFSSVRGSFYCFTFPSEMGYSSSVSLCCGEGNGGRGLDETMAAVWVVLNGRYETNIPRQLLGCCSRRVHAVGGSVAGMAAAATFYEK